MRTNHNFMMACFAIFIGLLLTEAALWIAFPLPEKDIARFVAHNNPALGLKKEILYEKNNFGFRSLSMHTVKKPANTIRIIALGASTTDQAAQATEDIWSAVLEKELREKLGSQKIQIEVAARGIGGQTVVDRLYWAQNNLSEFDPDLVILLEGINDLSWHGGPNYRYANLADSLVLAHDHADKLENSGPLKTFLRRFQIFRRLAILQHKIEFYWKMKKGTTFSWDSENLPRLSKEYRALPYVEKPERQPDPITEFSEGLSALVKFLQESNRHVVVLGQPVLWKATMSPDELNSLWFYLNTPRGPVRPSPAWLAKEMSRYNNIQREIAETLKVPFVDLNQKVPKDLKHFFDDCHFTDLGNAKVAAEILPTVQEQIEDILKKRASNS